MQTPTRLSTLRLMLISLICASCLRGILVAAQTEDSSDRPSAAVIGDWIRQLGDESFDKRQGAAERLGGAGYGAIPLLREAAQAKQLEIRLRVQSLLKDLERRLIDEKIAALLSDSDDTTEHDLPMWQTWRDIVGADADSRKFFAGILKSHYGFLDDVKVNSEKAAQEYGQRSANLLLEVLSEGRSANLADLAAILLVGSDEQIRFELTTALRLYSVLQSSRTVESVARSEFAEPVMVLLAHWIEQSSAHENFPSYGARLALSYQMDDLALAIARKSLARSNQGGNVGDSMDFPILVLALHGSPDDVTLLEKWFADKTRCGSWVDKKIETQVRDVALAAVIELSKQNLRDFGFEFAAEKTEGWFGWYPTYSLGFADDSKRQVAFEKWKNRQASTTSQ